MDALHCPQPLPAEAMKRLRNLCIALVLHLFDYWITWIPFYFPRHLYLKWILRIKIGRNSYVHPGCRISGRHIRIGDNSVVNRRCVLDGRLGIDIGDNVSISPEVCILSLSHDPQSPGFATCGSRVVIGNHVWIGTRALVLPGVTLHAGAVVGAGAVVTKDVPESTIVAGSPAGKIGMRNPKLEYTPKYNPLFGTDILLSP